jgi:hypothetical protein
MGMNELPLEMRELVESLPKRQRIAFETRLLDKKDFKTVGKKLRVGRSGAWALYQKSLETLRRKIEEEDRVFVPSFSTRVAIEHQKQLHARREKEKELAALRENGRNVLRNLGWL